MMPLFADYQPSRHTAPREMLRAQQFGLLPLAMTAVLMLVHRHPGPGLWSALGVSLGLQMILWGAYNLHRTHHPLSVWAADLVATQDRWFPLLMFTVKSLFAAIVLSLLWFSLVELGFSAAWWHHGVFVALAILLPARRLLSEMMRGEHGRRTEAWDEFTRQLLVILLSMGGASLLVNLMRTQAEGYPVEPTYLLLVVWIIATLISLSAGLLFFSRTFRRRKTYTVKAIDNTPSTPTDAESF